MSDSVNILCLKWGTLYSAEYVNRLYRGVKAHLHRPFRFVCVTDDSSGLVEGVETTPIPPKPRNLEFMGWYDKWPNVYVKLCLFEKGLAKLDGPTLFLDVDQVIVGDLDVFFDYRPGEFCIIRNWVEFRKRIFRKVPFRGNSSCFRFEAGEKSDYIYRRFLADLPSALDDRIYTTEQDYMTHAVGFDKVNFWPEDFVRSFKRSCAWPWPLNHFLTPRLKKDTRILCFHGNPTPIEAIRGYRGRHLNTWTKPAPWVSELWEEDAAVCPGQPRPVEVGGPGDAGRAGGEGMKIAVLIPVYNAEKYLRECLDSTLAAGREVERAGHVFEIVCCDDGSQDSSRAILREYASRHGNVHFIGQANAGVSATRNRLMAELPTDIDAFAFLDSDDTVRPEMYVRLAEAMERAQADVAETEWDGEERVIDDMSLYFLKQTAPGRWINVINKLYRRSSIGSIRFRAGLCFEEDLFFNFEVHQAIRRKVLVPGHYYHYRTNPSSATNTLDQRKYFESTTRRIRLSIDVFLNAGRVPGDLEPEFRRELAKDAYRMCLRKNLKKNRDPVLRRELFLKAGRFFADLERISGFAVVGLNPIQHALCCLTRKGWYLPARILTFLT